MITKLCFLSFCLFLYVFIPTIDILGFFYFVFIQVLYLFHPKCKAFLGNCHILSCTELVAKPFYLLLCSTIILVCIIMFVKEMVIQYV